MGLGASGILLGLVTYGHKVVQTLGVDIAVITPQKAAVSEMGTVVSMLCHPNLLWVISSCPAAGR